MPSHQPLREESNTEKSRGYVPIDLELVGAEISDSALGLLARLRAFSDGREQDGNLSHRDMKVLQVQHGIRPKAFERELDELVTAQLVERTETGIRDLRFTQHCRTRGERDRQREEWRARQDRKRNPSRRDTPVDTRGESHDSSGNVSDIVNVSGRGMPPPPADGPSLDDAYQRFVELWQSQKGRHLSSKELGELQSWSQFLDRLSVDQVLDVMGSIWLRERGQVTSPTYYRSRLIELHQRSGDGSIIGDGAKPRPSGQLTRGENEPPDDLAGPPVRPDAIRNLVSTLADKKALSS